MIFVLLNEKQVTAMDKKLWTSAKTNPDSEIPEWLSKPKAELPNQVSLDCMANMPSPPSISATCESR